MTHIRCRVGTIVFLFIIACTAFTSRAGTYEASFKNAEISEFISTVSKNLNKVIILDPTVKGHISVRSHEALDDEQYYQFFLSVLEVYGFAVINMNNGVLKVIPAKNARSGVIPLSRNGEIRAGDELITRVVQLQFVSAKDLAPLLRQLNEAAAGSVVHYEPSNVLLMTGRAAVIEQLMEIVENVDLPEDRSVDSIALENASASQVAELLNTLHGTGKNGTQSTVKAVADARTNALLLSGESSARRALAEAARRLDIGKTRRSNTKVIYLRHAKAQNLLEVLTGINTQSTPSSQGSTVPAVNMLKESVIKADTHTNALIITAPHDQLADLEAVIAQLDINRAQVLVEAVVVEVQDADALALGVQWFNKYGGGTQFPDAGATAGQLQSAGIADALAKMNGLAAGFYRGNWSGLLTALQSNSQNNILATPSIVTLDNMEAEFTVGQDVPVLTGSQTTSGDNVYQTVSRRSVGIKLKVKPQINKGDSVMMEIEQEVSSVAEDATKDNLGPTFNTRAVRNAVLVGSGNTVVIGGLLDSNGAKTQNAVPVLGDIPLIGGLFRYRSDKNSKRNLMLFIRPTIIRNGDGFSRSTRTQYDKFGEALARVNAGDAVRQELDTQLQIPRSNGALNDTRRLLARFYQEAR